MITFQFFMFEIVFPGSSFPIKHLPLSSLLPNTQQYLTYEGSTTHPGCWETAVWIIFNKPIYISKQEVKINCKSAYHDICRMSDFWFRLFRIAICD